jgi:hypothetical protein
MVRADCDGMLTLSPLAKFQERVRAHVSGMQSLAGSPSRQLPVIPTEGGSANTSGGPLDAA